jgi:GTPase
MAVVMEDRAKIHVEAGAGGDGCMSFRREAHVPRGGPDGGDGGRGGDVVLVCDESLRDLRGFRRSAHYRAGRGAHGEGSLRHGANGATLTLAVPPGTEARGVGADDLRARRWELVAAGQRARVARGGPGGRGNKRFATPTRQAPRFAERGLPGEEGWLQLQLKLLADVGLIGLPNAGKSSLLSRLTRATPKIANYPFTTLSPVLGVLEQEVSHRQLVIADIPGLIAGASGGAGLGHDFLAHVERTRVLVHVLDVAAAVSAGEGADPVANHAAIEHELAAYDPRLARLPRVLALSKIDLLTAAQAAAVRREWELRVGPEVPVVATSSATGAGVRELARLLLELVPALPAVSSAADAPGALVSDPRGGQAALASEPRGGQAALASEPGGEQAPAVRPDARTGVGAGEPELAEHMVFTPAGVGRGFTVERVAPGAFAVSGRGVERLLARYDVDNDDALAYLEERLRKIGVIGALQDAGFEPGDELKIAGVPFELDPRAR